MSYTYLVYMPRRAHLVTRTRQRGLTLIELMVSITIGLILLTGLVALFAQQSSTQQELERSSRQIENGRFAMQLLQDDLQMAGYYGEFSAVPLGLSVLPDPCSVNVTDDTNVSTYLPSALPFAVQGYKNPGAALPTDIAGCLDAANHLDGTDILVVRRVAPETLTGSLTTGAIYFQAGLTATTSEFRYVMKAATSSSVDTAVFTLKKKDGVATAPLRRYLVHIYYVSPCSVPANGSTCSAANTDDGGVSVPTLKRLELSTQSNAAAFVSVPLVEGIENLQIDYGFDVDADDLAVDGAPDSYLDNAAAVKDWANVMAVRINLLARNNERTNGYQDKKVYDLGNAGQAATAAASAASATITLADDRFKRRAFTQLVRLINPSARREKE